MKTDVPEKSFDCVAFMREQRARLSEKMNSMSGEEFRRWLRDSEYSDPRLAKLAAQARDAGKPSSIRSEPSPTTGSHWRDHRTSR